MFNFFLENNLWFNIVFFDIIVYVVIGCIDYVNMNCSIDSIMVWVWYILFDSIVVVEIG